LFFYRKGRKGFSQSTQSEGFILRKSALLFYHNQLNLFANFAKNSAPFAVKLKIIEPKNKV